METSGDRIVEEPGSASGKALHTDNTEGEEQCVENDRSLVPTPLRFLTRPTQNKGKPVLVANAHRCPLLFDLVVNRCLRLERNRRLDPKQHPLLHTTTAVDAFLAVDKT